ncbi:hypothetical protein [Methylobacterium thuringiense]|uniref:Uncharacterized protein n=1 Tax=Methylobacterium thuringiense TaxID=1003091 RepID=A0ABQ4TL54_9HYPH|nr:hypothetical protein [Methylobacterium thuringiense]GJE54548.1 hypothetical protein EKPJFOCH_1026 [Methylobacterium thuringiense]
MISAIIARLTASALRGAAVVLLWIGDFATPVLAASRFCDDRAREWDPRLWDRNEDDRTDTRERRP